MTSLESTLRPPSFLAELILQNGKLITIPTEDQFANGLSNLMTKYQETMLSVNNLVTDCYFD
ncbi:unnamed protein product, partial [Hymenolepis diminuta]